MGESASRSPETPSWGEFTAHHVAISVADLEASLAFYGRFGYRLVVEWTDPGGDLRIIHLQLTGGHILEVFAYRDARPVDGTPPSVGNDLEVIGVKHLAVQVSDLAECHQRIAGELPTRTTPIRHGRTGIDYFFVADPDGYWVEVVEDQRVLDPAQPLRL
jgi:glyoxylase I family protein